MQKRKYPQWFVDELVNEEDRKRAKSGDLKTSDYCVFICNDCGNIYNQRVGKHINLSKCIKLQGCPKCCVYKIKDKRREYELSKSRKYPEWFIDELVDENDKKIAKDGSLLSTCEVKFYCKECQNTYLQKVKYHINLSTGESRHKCPKCATKRQYKSRIDTIINKRNEYPQWFIDELVNEDDIERAKNKTLLSTETVYLRCKEGHIFKSTVCSHLNLNSGELREGCPICAKKRSKCELEIEKYVNSLGYLTEHKRFSKGNKSYEVDIFIPAKNIAIEYNGSYWHQSYPITNKDKFYHQNKYLFFKNLGIRLLNIYDVDWNSSKCEKYKKYLNNILSQKERLYARKCEIRPITLSEANSLYENYHLLGKLFYSSVNYGLFFNEELISCMSFQEKRYKEGWCLCRFVTKENMMVIGGASRLFNMFIKEYDPEKVISFSDNDVFSGEVYEKLGFEDSGNTNSPRYYWYLNGNELSRESCQLSKLKERFPEIYEKCKCLNINKEDYIMSELGAFKVYRSGHTKWVYKNIE